MRKNIAKKKFGAKIAQISRKRFSHFVETLLRQALSCFTQKVGPFNCRLEKTVLLSSRGPNARTHKPFDKQFNSRTKY